VAAASPQLKYKFGFIAAVILACLIGILCIDASGLKFPTSVMQLKQNLSDRIHLGLDLRGGSHLVVQVQLEDAIRQYADQAVDLIKDQARTNNVSIGDVSEVDDTHILVKDVDPNAASKFRDIVTNQLSDWTLGAAAGQTNGFLLTLPPTAVATRRSNTMDEALETITRRIDALGLTEPTIAFTGRAQDEILVELPGEGDPTRAKQVISQGGQLELTLIGDDQPGGYPSEAEALAAHNGVLPAGTVILPGQPSTAPGQTGPSTVYYVVNRAAIVTGQDLQNASPAPSTSYPGQYVVNFVLSNAAAARFGPFTGENVGKYLAIVLDGQVKLDPVIHDRMDTGGQIEGNFSQADAQDLALVLRSGALPASIKYLEEDTVGPSLGADSIRDGVRASLGSIIVVMIFLVIYYRLSGVNAVVALFLNLVILLAAMAYFGAVLTLPGIAGVILTIGMGVDSNVLVFERIREELRNGKASASAVDVGFEKAFLTIIDTHVTTVVSAVFLFLFGSGPVKGFAITLIIGLIANVFTSIYVSRAIFDLHLAHMRRDEPLSV
jgi:preprotein translocase subunit SecD